MTALVVQWTGREIRALRLARRMSVRAFAAHLGVSDRMVSKWESGGEAIRPRSENQAALDTSLATGGPEVRARFEKLVGAEVVHVEDVYSIRGIRHLVRHPIDGKLMTLVEPGPYTEMDAGPGLAHGVLHRPAAHHLWRLRAVRFHHRASAARAVARRRARRVHDGHPGAGAMDRRAGVRAVGGQGAPDGRAVATRRQRRRRHGARPSAGVVHNAARSAPA